MTSRDKSTNEDGARQGKLTNEHRRVIERMRSTRSYFTFCHAFMDLGLSIEQAVVLQDMINVGSMKRASDGDGWFVYSVKRMEKRLKVRRNPQQRLINRLIKLTYIRTKKVGLPAKRHVWIDLVKIENDLSILDQQAKPPSGGKSARKPVNPKPCRLSNPKPCRALETNSSLRSEKISNVARTAATAPAAPRSPVLPTLGAGAAKIHTGDEQCRLWALRLAKVVEEIHKYRQKKSITAWSQAFGLLLQDVGDDAARVEKVLAWYEGNAVTYKYRVVSADKFRKRFMELEDNCRNSVVESPTQSFNVEVLKLTEFLKAEHVWPTKALPGLPAAVDATMGAWTEFVRRARAWRGEVVRKGMKIVYSDPENEPLERLYDAVAAEGWMVKSPEAFAKKWFAMIHAKKVSKGELYGNITKLAFSPDSSLWDEIGQAAANKRGSPRLWARLKEVLS